MSLHACLKIKTERIHDGTILWKVLLLFKKFLCHVMWVSHLIKTQYLIVQTNFQYVNELHWIFKCEVSVEI